jgi:methylamine dehydrogenase accessory protein MauD
MNEMWLASYVALWVVVGLLVTVVLALARQIGLLHRRLPPYGARMGNPGPEIGDPAPGLDGIELRGREVALGSKRGRRTLLVFVSPDCQNCAELAPAVRSVARSESGRMDTVLVSLSPHQEANEAFVRSHRLHGLPLLMAPPLGSEYGVAVTPYAVLAGEDGIVRAKGLVNNLEQLESLINAADSGHPSVESLMQLEEEAIDVPHRH